MGLLSHLKGLHEDVAPPAPWWKPTVDKYGGPASRVVGVLVLTYVMVRALRWIQRWLLAPLRMAESRSLHRGSEVADRAKWLSDVAEREKLVGVHPERAVMLTVVIPAYNERHRLPKMLRECAEFLKDWDSFEILVVDDGSFDNTAVVADEAGAALFPAGRVRVARLAKNRGKGGAVREGALRARGEWILLCDADGATRFSDLGRLWRERERAAIVVGSRAHLVGTAVVARRSPLRNILMRCFHVFVSHVGGVRGVRDTQCGFKLIQREALPALAGLHLERWAFDVEMLFIAQSLDLDILEVEVQWHEVEGSKLNVLRDSIQMARDILCLRLAYTFRIWSLPEESGGEDDQVEESSPTIMTKMKRRLSDSVIRTSSSLLLPTSPSSLFSTSTPPRSPEDKLPTARQLPDSGSRRSINSK